MLETAGLFGGKTKAADRWNPRGYFENVAISDLMVRYLRDNDTQNLGKKFYPLTLPEQYLGFGYNVTAILQEEGWDGRQSVYYKHARLGICWRLWHHYFPNAKWVVVKRDREETISSLMRTEFMDAWQTREEWSVFLDYHLGRIEELKLKVQYHVFDINRVFDGDEGEVVRLLDYAGGTFSPEVMSCIERKHWNGRAA